MNDSKEFISLVQKYEGIIYKVARAYEPNMDIQKDLFQEIVYQLWKAYPKFRGEAKFSTWLYRIALNTSLTYSHRKKRQLPEQLIAFDWPGNLIENDDAREEQIQQLYRSIQQLNKIEKGLILLYLEGNSYKEIGKIMGLTETNVGTRMNRIKKKLRSLVKIY